MDKLDTLIAQVEASLQKENKKGSSLSLKKLWTKLKHKWIIMLILLLLPLAAAWIYTRFATPKYRSSIEIMINKERESNRNNSVTSEILGQITGWQTTSNLQDEIKIINSEAVIGAMVRRLGLNTRYYDDSERFNRKELAYEASPVLLTIDSSLLMNEAFSIGVQIEDEHSFRITRLESADGGLTPEEEKQVFAFNVPIQLKNISTNFSLKAVHPEKGRNIHIESQTIADVALRFGGQLDFSTNSTRSGVKSSVIVISMNNSTPEYARKFLSELVNQYNIETRAYNDMCYEQALNFLDACADSIRTQLEAIDAEDREFSDQNFIVDIAQQSSRYLDVDKEIKDNLADCRMQLQLLHIIRQYMQDMGSDYRVVPANIGVSDPQMNTVVLKFNDLVLRRSNFLTSMGDDAMRVKTINNQIDDMKKTIILSADKLSEAYRTKEKEHAYQLRISNERLATMPGKRTGIERIAREREIVAPLYKLLQQKRAETLIARAAEQDIARVIVPPITAKNPVWPNKQIIAFIALMAGLFLALFYFIVSKAPKEELSIEDIVKNVSFPIWGVLPSDKRQKDFNNALESIFVRISMGGHRTVLVTSSNTEEGKTTIATALSHLMEKKGKKVLLLTEEKETDLSAAIKRYEKDNYDYIVIDGGAYHNQPSVPLLSQQADVSLYVIRMGFSQASAIDFAEYARQEGILMRAAVVINDADTPENLVSFGGFDYAMSRI